MGETIFVASVPAAPDSDSIGGTVAGIALILLICVVVVLFVAAVVSAVRSRNYAAGGKAVWILLMFTFPLLGPVVWFVWGRRSSMVPPQSS
nr:PLD nuclease N-terminal domain-containing protein [Nocardia inohanensis]